MPVGPADHWIVESEHLCRRARADHEAGKYHAQSAHVTHGQVDRGVQNRLHNSVRYWYMSCCVFELCMLEL